MTLRTVAHQVPLSMGFPSQEYWSGLPCPPLGRIFLTQSMNSVSCSGRKIIYHWATREVIYTSLVYTHTHTHTYIHTHVCLYDIYPKACLLNNEILWFISHNRSSSIHSFILFPNKLYNLKSAVFLVHFWAIKKNSWSLQLKKKNDRNRKEIQKEGIYVYI